MLIQQDRCILILGLLSSYEIPDTSFHVRLPTTHLEVGLHIRLSVTLEKVYRGNNKQVRNQEGKRKSGRDRILGISLGRIVVLFKN